MIWSFPLKLLQLVAACMGGSGLAATCKALAVSYRHFSAGAPDLLLIRVRQRDLPAGEYTRLETLLGAGWEKMGAVREEDLKDEEETDWNSLSIGAPKRTFSQYQNSNSTSVVDDSEEMAPLLESAPNVKIDPFLCMEEGFDSLQLLGANLSEWIFETLFIEVKGPSDHLAYKQRLWLEILGKATHSLKAAVCFVKEK
jgi:hypothetical protein